MGLRGLRAERHGLVGRWRGAEGRIPVEFVAREGTGGVAKCFELISGGAVRVRGAVFHSLSCCRDPLFRGKVPRLGGVAVWSALSLFFSFWKGIGIQLRGFRSVD